MRNVSQYLFEVKAKRYERKVYVSVVSV